MKDKRKYLIGITIMTIIIGIALAMFFSFANADLKNDYVIDILEKEKEKETEDAKIKQTIIESESNDTELTYQIEVSNKAGRDNHQVAIILDNSYSMTVNTTANNAKQVARNLANNLCGSAKVSFASNDGLRVGMGANSATTINNSINSVNFTSTKDLGTGIQSAYNSFNLSDSTAIKTIIIITDSTDIVKAKYDQLASQNINVVTITTGITNNVIGTAEEPTYGLIYMLDTLISKADVVTNYLLKDLTGVEVRNTFTEHVLEYFDITLVTTSNTTRTDNGFTWTPPTIGKNNATFKYKLKLKPGKEIDRNIIYKDWYSAETVNLSYSMRSTLKNLDVEKTEGPKFRICETYSMRIKAVSSDNNYLPVEGVVFNISGTGLKEPVTVTSDAYGYVTIDKLRKLDTVNYVIEPQVDIKGYSQENTSPRTIEINNDYLGRRVIEVVNSDGLKYTVDDDRRIVNLEFPIETQKFGLEVNLTELYNKTVPLEGVEFRLIQPTVNNKYDMKALYGKTDSNGQVIFKPTMMMPSESEKTYEYILSQMSELPGYSSMGNVTLRITFDSMGNMLKIVKVYNDKVTAELIDPGYAVVNVGNENVLTDGFNFELNLTDSETGNGIDGADYSIQVVDYNGATYNYNRNITTDNGKINLMLPGSGYVTIKVVENSPAPGYAKNSTSNEILVQRLNNTVNQIATRTPVDLDVTADSNNDKVILNLQSKLKGERNVVRVEVIDKDELDEEGNPLYYIPDVEFKLTNTVTGAEYTTNKTDEKGIAEFVIDDEPQGTYKYKIEAINIPFGYNAFEPIKFNLEFDKNKHICNANDLGGPIDFIEARDEDDGYNKLHTAFIRTHLSIDDDKSYLFEVELKDAESKDGIKDALYDIEIKAGEFVKNIVARPTDEDGKIQTRIFIDKSKTNLIEIIATEKQAAQRYVADTIPQELAIDVSNNIITHTPAEKLPSDTGIHKYATIKDNTITYHHTNRKKTADDILLNLSINTISKDSEMDHAIPIGGTSLEITSIVKEEIAGGQELKYPKIVDPDTNDRLHKTVTTPTDDLNIGHIELKGLQVKEFKDRSATYIVTILVNKKKTVKLRIQLGYNAKDEIECTGIEVPQGNELIPFDWGKQKVSSVTNNGYEISVTLNIRADYDETGNLSLDLIKKSIDDESILSGAKYDVIVERSDGSKLINKDIEITNDIEYDGLYVPLDSKIYITEKEAPKGYSVNDSTIVLKVSAIDELTKEVTLEVDKSTSSKVKSKIKLNKGAPILLASGAVQSVYSLDMLDAREDIFELQIDAIDKDNQSKGIPNAKFNIDTSKGSHKTTKETDKKGEVSIKVGGRYDSATSPVTYTIENVQAGEYYKKLINKINMQVYFTDENEVDVMATLAGQTDPHYVVNGTNVGDWWIVTTNKKDKKGNIVKDIELKVVMEKQDPLKVEIETVDKFSNQVITTDMGYSIRNSLGITNGILDSNVIKASVNYVLTNGVETYDLMQTVATGSKYISLDNLSFTVTYDSNGDINASIPVTTNNSNLQVVSATGKTLKLRVYVEPMVPITFENSRYFDHNVKLQGAEFQIVSATNVALGQATTGSNGKGVAYIGRFGTSQIIRYRIKQTKAAVGYATIEEFEIDVEYGANREILSANLVVPDNRFVTVGKIQPSTSAHYGYIGNDKGIVTIEIFSYPEMVFNIENVDRQDNTKKLAGANYQVTSSIGTEDNNVTTGSDGIGKAHLDRTVLDNSIVYTIKEIAPAPNYQSLYISAKIEVFFDENGYVNSANILRRDDVMSYTIPEGASADVNPEDLFRVDITIQSNVLEKLSIHKVDKDDPSIVLKDVDFEVTARVSKNSISGYTEEELNELIIDNGTMSNDDYLGEVIERLKINSDDILEIRKEIVVEEFIKELQNANSITQEQYDNVMSGINGTDKINRLIDLKLMKKGQSNTLIKDVTNLQVINVLISEEKVTQPTVDDLLDEVKRLVKIDVDRATTDAAGNTIALMDKTLANKTIEYTIKETRKAMGYDWPDEIIILEVQYDNTGKMAIDARTGLPLVKKVSGDMEITNVNVDDFQVDLTLYNKPSDEIQIHITVEDVYDRNKRLEIGEYNAYLTNANFVKDPKYQATLASNGASSAQVSSNTNLGIQTTTTGAHGEDIASLGVYEEKAGTRVLKIDEITKPDRYYIGNQAYFSTYQSIKYHMLFNVTFNDEGGIVEVGPHNWGGDNTTIGGYNADSRYLKITHTRNTIDITIRYYPMLEMAVHVQDKYTKQPVSGEKFLISTSDYNPGDSQVSAGFIDVLLDAKNYEQHYNDTEIAPIDSSKLYKDYIYKGCAPIEAERKDLGTDNYKIRKFYIYEESEPKQDRNYQKYRRRDANTTLEKRIGAIAVKYDSKGEVIETWIDSETSHNNIHSGYLSSLIVDYGDGINDNKHHVDLTIEYAPRTIVTAKAEDSLTQVGMEGVKFDPYLNDTEVSKTSYEYRTEYEYYTNTNGYTNWTYWGANIDNGVAVYKIKASNLKEGYLSTDADTTIEVEVTYDSEGNIASAKVLSRNTFNDANAYIDESCYGTTELKLIFKMERTLGLQINKIDKYDSTVNLAAKFKITSDIDSSITNGEEFIINTADQSPQVAGRMLAGKTVEYTLSEVGVPDGYIAPGNTLKLRVSYNMNGTIKSIKPVDSFTEQYLTVNYYCETPRTINGTVNKDIEITITNEPKLAIELQMLDKFYNNIQLENVELAISNNKGDTGVGNLVTNSSGSISTYVGPVYPNETITYTIEQKTKASGYYKLTAPISFTVKFDESGKAVDIPNLTDSYSQEYAKLLNNDLSTFRNTHTARLEIYNMPEDVKLGIAKYDQLTKAPLQNVQFKVTVEENGLTHDVTGINTNTEGLAVAKIDTFKETATGRVVTYTIHEVNQPDSYRRMQDLVIKVVYAADGGITSWLELSNNSALEYDIYARGNTSIVKVDNKYVHMDLKVPNDNTYDLMVKDEDSTYSGLGIEGTKYDVTVDGVIKELPETDTLGNTSVTKLKNSGNFKIVIAERSLGEGYRRNTQNNITLEIQKAAVGAYSLKLDTASMTDYTITTGISSKPTELVYNVVLDATTGNTAIVKIDETYGTIQVIFKNEPMLELTLLKQDINTKIPLQGVKFEITAKDINTGVIDTITTEENNLTGNDGKLYFDLGSPIKNTTIEYTIKELTNPEPATTYSVIMQPQSVTVVYDSFGKIMSMEPNPDSQLRTQAILKYKNEEETDTQKSNCRSLMFIVGNGVLGEEGYKVKIVSQDATTGKRINGSKFDVEVKDSANTILASLQGGVTQNLSTDGKYYSDKDLKSKDVIEKGIVKTKGITQSGKIYINVNQTEFKEGYTAGTQKTDGIVALTTSLIANPNGSQDDLLEATIDDRDGLEVSVNESAREITIVIKNESRVTLNITKVKNVLDAKGNKKEEVVSGATFTITSEILTATEHRPTDLNVTTRPTGDKGTTSESIGEAIAQKGIVYTIHENDLEGYEKIEDIQIYVLYGLDGYIKECELLSNFADVSNEVLQKCIGKREIDLKVFNKPIISDYKIVIEKHHISDDIYKDLIPGVEFNIKVQEEFGKTKEWNAITNINGLIISDYFSGHGIIKIDIQEILPVPKGYKANPFVMHTVYKRDETTGWIEQTSADLNAEVDQENQIIYLKPVNEFADNTYALTIDKIDITTNKMIENNSATFDVEITKEESEPEVKPDETTEPDTEDKDIESETRDAKEVVGFKEVIEDIKTDNTGRATKIGIPLPEDPGTYIFEIKEKGVPTGYVKDPSPIKYRVVIQENKEGVRSIKSAEKISGDYSSILKVGKNIFAIKVGNEEEKAVLDENEYKIDIAKVDKDKKLIEGDAIFKITAPDGTVQYLPTEDGKIYLHKLAMPKEEGTITYKIQEIMAPEGYKLDRTEKTLKVKFVKDTEATTEEKVMLKIESAEVTGTNIEVTSNTEKSVSVSVTNEKGINEGEESKDKYSIILNKVDQYKRPITKPAKFEITLENGQKVKAATDKDGRIVIEDVATPSKEGKYTYVIQEVTAPEGYKLDSEYKILEFTFTNVDGVMTITAVNVVSGSHVSAKAINTGRAAEVEFVDEKQGLEDGKYSVSVKKVDKSGKVITKPAKFKVVLPNGKAQELSTDKYGMFEFNGIDLPKTEGSIEYRFKEIEAPEGYKLDSEEKVIQVTFKRVNGKVTLTGAKVKSGSNIKVEVKGGEVLVSITNKSKSDSDNNTNNTNTNNTTNNTNTNNTTNNTNTNNTTNNTNTNNTTNNTNTNNTTNNTNNTTGNITINTNNNTFGGNTIVSGNTSGGNTINNVNGGNSIFNIITGKDDKTEGFDIQTKKYLTSITQLYTDTNEKKVINIAKTDKATKLEVNANRLPYLSLQLEYKIILTNVGTESGIVNYIQDKMPNNLTIDLPKNRNWNQNGDIITYTLGEVELKPGESREATIILKYDGGNHNPGPMVNYATFVSEDADVNNRNDFDKATFILSIKTGYEFVMYGLLTLTMLVTFGTGVYYIKKYVL